MHGHRGLRIALALIFLVLPAIAVAGDETRQEYPVKAAFLYNFAKFVEWPQRAFVRANTPIAIGAFCTEAFGATLEQVVRGRTINGRTIVVRTLRAADEAPSVQLVFVCSDQAAMWSGVAKAIRDFPVLTVTDSEPAAAPDGMIVFVMERDQVRFRVNMIEAGRAGLKISDQLQKLALPVRRSP